MEVIVIEGLPDLSLTTSPTLKSGIAIRSWLMADSLKVVNLAPSSRSNFD
jgi:hypothetical protein